MPAKPISHIEHRVPGTAVWRPGFTSHEETGTDLRDYLRPLEQVHNSCLHGSGVVEGFTVSASPGSSSVTVMPGVAVDPAGRHIVLPADGPAETADDPDTSSTVVNVPASGIELPVAGHGDNVLVTLQWRETFVDPPTAGDAAFVTRHTPWLRVVAADAEPAADRLVLATLVLGADGKIAAGGLRDTGRAALSLSTGALTLGATTVRSVAGTATLGEGPTARLIPRSDGGLDVRLPGSAGQPALTVTGTGGAGSTVRAQAVDVTGAATVGGAVRITGPLTAGATVKASALDVTGAATVGGAVRITGPLTAGATVKAPILEVTGAATVGGSVRITGALDVTGPLSTTGALTAGSTVKASALDVTGAATVGGAVRIGGGLTVTGALQAGTASATSLTTPVLNATNLVGESVRVGSRGGVLNHVTVGSVGTSPAADPQRMAYPFVYETVGVNLPEHNLRLQSPGVIATHTYDAGSRSYPERVRISADGGLALLTIGPGANGRLWTRHIDGKHWLQDAHDGLHLNYATGQPVVVGNPNNLAELRVHGPINAQASIVTSGSLVGESVRVGSRGGVLNHVTVGSVGTSPAADPQRMAYPFVYETVGVNLPEHNLRLQSPGVIATHTYDAGSRSYPERVRISADGGLALLTIGPGANGRLWTRHIDGKHWLQDAHDGLHLNYATGQPVVVGNPNNLAELRVHGPINAQASIVTSGSLGTSGRSAPPAWSGGGVVTHDLFAAGGVYVGEPLDDPPVQIYGGRVRAQSKSFDIAHPVDQERRLVHGCLEGPELAVYYRGRGRLVDGQARVELPAYFEALTRAEDRTVQLTPIVGEAGTATPLGVSPVENGAFRVVAVAGGDPDGQFFWEVTAVRADVEPLDVEPHRQSERVLAAADA